MPSIRWPFESTAQRMIQRLRQFSQAQTPYVPSGYYSASGGAVQPLTGDDDAPYAHAISRASADAQTGSVQVQNGNAQRLLSDLYGRLWAVAMHAKLPTNDNVWNNTNINNVTGITVKNAPGRLARIEVINTSATGLYVLLHDSTAFGTLGTIRWRGFVPAQADGVPCILDLGFEEDDGLYFSEGISMSTSTSLTAIAGAVAVYGNALWI